MRFCLEYSTMIMKTRLFISIATVVCIVVKTKMICNFREKRNVYFAYLFKRKNKYLIIRTLAASPCSSFPFPSLFFSFLPNYLFFTIFAATHCRHPFAIKYLLLPFSKTSLMENR